MKIQEIKNLPKRLAKYKARYWRADTIKERRAVIYEMADLSLLFVQKKSATNSGAQTIKQLVAIDEAAQKLASRPLEIDEGWKLHKHWFRTLFGQLCGHALTKEFYTKLGWNYEEALNPPINRRTTVETWYNTDAQEGDTAEIKLLYEATEEFLPGELWRSTTGKEWEIIEVSEQSIELVSEDAIGRIIKLQRTPAALREQWKEVA
jgi:hypothetical protein